MKCNLCEWSSLLQRLNFFNSHKFGFSPLKLSFVSHRQSSTSDRWHNGTLYSVYSANTLRSPLKCTIQQFLQNGNYGVELFNNPLDFVILSRHITFTAMFKVISLCTLHTHKWRIFNSMIKSMIFIFAFYNTFQFNWVRFNLLAITTEKKNNFQTHGRSKSKGMKSCQF